MSKQHVFEKPRLKQLLTIFMKSGCDFEQTFPQQFKATLLLHIQKTIPRIQLGDGFTFIEAIFTKEAVNSFRKQFSHLRFSQLQDKLVKVHKWSFQLKQRNSQSCLNSSQNFAVYISVSDFTPVTQKTVSSREIQNVFDDQDIKTLISNCRYEYVRSLIGQKIQDQLPLGFGSFQMPRAVDFYQRSNINSQKICEAGVVRLNADNTTASLPEAGWLQSFRNDTSDLEEFKFQLNPEEIEQEDANALYQISGFYDMQKILIQELGEDKYYHRYNKEKDKEENQLQIRLNQERRMLNVNHWSVGKVQSENLSGKLKVAEKKEKKQQKVLQYVYNNDKDQIKNKIVEIMTNAEERKRKEQANRAKDDFILQPKTSIEELEFRENIIHVEALSQYVFNEQSQMFEDSAFENTNRIDQSETESEISEDEQERQDILKSNQFCFEDYRTYLMWFSQHQVQAETVKSGWVQEEKKTEEISIDQLMHRESSTRQKRKNYQDRGSSEEDDSSEEEKVQVVEEHKPQEIVWSESSSSEQSPKFENRPQVQSNLGKRRFAHQPSLITDFISNIRDAQETGKLSVGRIDPSRNYEKPKYEEVLQVVSDSDSDEEDPHTATQLQNNESLAQCSQDTYEEQDITQLILTSGKQTNGHQISPKRSPLSLPQLKEMSLEQLFQRKVLQINQ